MANFYLSPKEVIIEGISPSYLLAVNYHLVHGLPQWEACIKAGLSEHTRKDVFQRHSVIRKVLETYMEEHKEIDPDKKELIDFYRRVINAPYNTPVNELMPPKGYTKEFIGSTTIEEKWVLVRQGTTDAPHLAHRVIKYRNITEADRINAAKELSILLGIREEKSKLDVESSLIDVLQKRRTELAGDSPVKEASPEVKGETVELN